MFFSRCGENVGNFSYFCSVNPELGYHENNSYYQEVRKTL